MAVERRREASGSLARPGCKSGAMDDCGQSLIEFLLVLPFMFGLTVVMIRVNQVIQMSIVNQKYARAQALYLAQNSPIYPRRDQVAGNFIAKQTNQLVMGVADNPFNTDALSEGQAVPIASTQLITRSLAQANIADPSKVEPERRAKVRVRTTVSLCTDSKVIAGGGAGGAVGYSASTLGESKTAAVFLYCNSGRGDLDPVGVGQ